jgi:prevent-host-death family protein
MPDLHIKDLRRNTGALIDRVLGGERFTVYRFDRPVAALVSITDLERLEESMSEDRAPYTPDDAAPDLTEQMEQMLREDLAGYLAFNAYHQAHSDKTEAIRALAEAILKVQALP